MAATPHEPADDLREPQIEPPVGLEADDLEDHGNGALHMPGPVVGIDAVDIGAGAAPPVIGLVAAVRRIISVGELVILRFRDAVEGDQEPAPAAQPLPLQIAPQMAVKQLVMTQLVGGDVAISLSAGSSVASWSVL